MKELAVAVVALITTGLQAPQTPPRDAARAGAATAAVSGSVTDRETGKPLRRMKVTLSGAGSHRERILEGVADAEGRYAIAGIPAGQYSVGAGPDEFGAGYAPVEDGRLSLEAGEHRMDVDVALARTYAVEGRVTNESGEPLADVSVWAERIDRSMATRFTPTDDRGLFRSHGLVPGAWRICAGGSGGQSGRRCVPDEAVERSGGIRIGAADVAGVEIQMPGRPQRLMSVPLSMLRLSLRGTSAVAGRVTDRDTGAPIAGAVVTVGTSRADGSRVDVQVTADEDGRFEASGLRSGFLRVAVPAGQRATHLPGYYPSRSARGREVMLKDGERRTDLVIALARAHSISGRVTDEAAQPLAGAVVRLRAAGGGPLVDAVKERTTDDRGVYRLFGVPPGEYIVCADLSRDDEPNRMFGASSPVERFVDACHTASSTEQDAQTVGVSGDVDGVEIVARRSRTFTISGQVVDSAGTAVEAQTVMLHRYGLFGSAVAGTRAPNGAFAFRNLVPGEYAIEARQGGDGSRTFPWATRGYVPVRIDATDITDLVVGLKGPVTVPGRVVFEDGPPERDRALVIDAAVVPRGAPRNVPTSPVGLDGSFTIERLFDPVRILVHGVPRGWVVKAIRYNGQDITDEAAAFQNDSRHDIEVTLTSRVAVVTGTVTDDAGKPVEDAVVYLLPGEPKHLTTDLREAPSYTVLDRGRFSTGPLRPGDYLIIAVSGEQAERLTERSRTVDHVARHAERITLVENDRLTINLRVVTLPEK